MILIGLDLGTQGVRAIAADASGTVLATAAAHYDQINTAPEPYKEQDAAHWRAAALSVLSRLSAALGPVDAGEPVLLAVDGTSGTILPLDRQGNPLCHALMYNDGRAAAVLDTVRRHARPLEETLGYSVGASFALPKLYWLQQHRPDIYGKTWRFVHQADYLVGVLTGEFGVTDYSNALKTCYDLVHDCWPSALLDALSIDASLLPSVVAPGTPIGPITAAAAAETGLPRQTIVTAGATDGYASCVASGVVRPGQYNTTIGTTLVLKGVTEHLIRDPQGRVYCHKHPEGYWYPGGAGNVGGICLNQWFGADAFDRLNAQVPDAVPTGNLIYPLTTTGERFPFVCPTAQGFSILRRDDEVGRYAGTMEGVAYVERLCYDTLTDLGCAVGGEITIAGGAVKSPQWSQIRADVLGRCLVEPETVEAAFGMAMIAGTTALHRTLTEAAGAMVRTVRRFEPRESVHAVYNESYEAFLAACRERGYFD